MTRLTGTLVAFVSLFLLLLMTLAWTEMHGFVSARTTELWAKAIVQVDGPAVFKSTEAFYPPLPFILTLSAQWLVADVTPVPIPFLLSAALGAALLLLWFDNLRDNGSFTALGSCIAVALLALNPFFLRSLADGPESVLTLIGTWVFARGLVNLRLTGNAPDMMKVAVGLLIVSLSNSYGLLICLGAMPFMIVAARPSMLVASPFGYLVSMFFPVLVAVVSILFVSEIFDSNLIPLLSEGEDGSAEGFPLATMLGLASVVLVVVARTVTAPRYFMPLLATFGTVLGAYLLNAVYHVESDPAVAIAPMLAVVAVAVRFWPPLKLREPIVAMLLALGAVLSVISLRVGPVEETRAWMTAFGGNPVKKSILTQDVAVFLNGKSEIMVDVEKNAELVTALGRVDNLIVAGQPMYEMAMQGAAPRSNYIVVRTGSGQTGASDRIMRRFPQLSYNGLPLYEEVFQNPEWKVFQRVES